MDDFQNYYKTHINFKKEREHREKEISKERLLEISKKKIQTTMIGALSSIEKHLAFLWESNDSQQLKEIFDELRSEILDRGNTQIRNLENEFTNYEILWKKYNINLPFKKENRDGQ